MDYTEHVLTLDHDGVRVRGRLTGRKIGESERGDMTVYLTIEENVVVYDGDNEKYWIVVDPETDLRDILDTDTYIQVMGELDIEPDIKLDV